MSQITHKVIAAIEKSLRDDTYGLNANLLSEYQTGAYPGVQAPPRFDLDTGVSFFRGNVSPSEVDDTTIDSYPLLMLYGQRIESKATVRFALFSGTVEIGFDIWLAWADVDASVDFNSTINIVEAAIIKTINGSAFAASLPVGVTYNGEIQMERSPIDDGGPHWRQKLASSLRFSLHTS